MPVNTPVTWTMTPAQLVTPTSSQLSVVNAIQSAITACPDWTVNSTGTTSTGYKYVEAKPANPASIYSEYRILFIERVNASTTNRQGVGGSGGASIFNGTSNICVLFVPDGGAPWCTFTPANIEVTTLGQNVYMGTKFNSNGTSTGIQTFVGINLVCTALWLYTADGVMHIVSRQSPTSHSVTAFGNVFLTARPSLKAFNSSGVETGLPSMYIRNALANADMAVNFYGTSINTWMYVWSAAAISNYYGYTQVTASPVIDTTVVGRYEATGSTIGLAPLLLNLNTLGSMTVLRGVYIADNLKTRTTLKDTTGTLTIGYTFFPADTLSGNGYGNFCYMNS